MKIMAEEQEPAKASERYRKTIEGYKSRLALEPDLRLKDYCKEVYCNYHSLGHWCSRMYWQTALGRGCEAIDADCHKDRQDIKG